MTTIATFLNYREIKRILPWLARWIDRSPRLQAISQNSLPSVAIITFNGLLPFLLGCECASYLVHPVVQPWKDPDTLQGWPTIKVSSLEVQWNTRFCAGELRRTWGTAVAYSTRRYHFFLLVTIVFIFLLTTTFWALVRDLADSPAKVSPTDDSLVDLLIRSCQIPEKLAIALQQTNVKPFMISYVMLQCELTFCLLIAELTLGQPWVLCRSSCSTLDRSSPSAGQD